MIASQLINILLTCSTRSY